MTPAIEIIKCDGDIAPMVENESGNLMYDSPYPLSEFELKSLALQDLNDRLLVTKERVVKVLTRTDDFHNFIEDLMWKTQIDERQKGNANGVTSSQLHTIKETFERMKWTTCRY